MTGGHDRTCVHERLTVAALVVSLISALAAIAAVLADASARTFGIAVAAALGAIGAALVWWSKSLGLDEDVVQERDPLSLTDDDIDDLSAEIDATRATIGRRPLLGMLLGGAVGALAIAVLPPVGALGRRATGNRKHTSWAKGRRLVTSEGVAIKADADRFDQLATVFPEGHPAADDSQVVLLRVPSDSISRQTIEAGSVDGWIAYSKICTHLGCSVGLFGIDTREPQTVRQLVCPCHQSVFDPLDGARPVGGPAPRPLPQLPLEIDDQGYLVAAGDFDRPVGPATWNEA